VGGLRTAPRWARAAAQFVRRQRTRPPMCVRSDVAHDVTHYEEHKKEQSNDPEHRCESLVFCSHWITSSRFVAPGWGVSRV
jgi:hypothetical protein